MHALILTCLTAYHAEPARAAITGAQTLVVYNSAATDATALKNAYLAAHPDIPAENVLDLNNAALNTHTLTYANFISLVRDPIRAYLDLPGNPTPSGIIVIALIRPFPHRVEDTDTGAVGDNAGNATTEFSAGDNTCAALDAELVLLWQNLTATEAGGTMDSPADNLIDNPYHTASVPMTNFSRVNIKTQKVFTNLSSVAWGLGGIGSTRLNSGDLYLVCRIDGTTHADALAVINRAKNLYVNKPFVHIILDEFDVTVGDELDDDPLFTSGDPFLGGDDYEEARNLLQAASYDVRYDGTFDFIESTEPLGMGQIIAYASYGENHDIGGWGQNPPGGGIYINNFTFPPGAIFNTAESWNGRALNGLATLGGQEQIADFITAGGTFAVGNVFEPFSFSLPDNEFMLRGMLIGTTLTWAEAAYSGIPGLSWQQIVLGDPLARPAILSDPAPITGDLTGDGRRDGRDIAWFTDILTHGIAAYRAAFPTLDPIARCDFTGDYRATTADQPAFTAAILAGP